ncbi:MAG TPA: ABC transporter ATP-binding protein [Anaerolineae bacterium]|nr:ABC transporter ATP-binding protein [Anaerolineae bacterium]
MTVLQADRVTKQYRMGELTVSALDTVNFAVETGEFVAIMGPSGSGKSTLLHLLGGLDGTSHGEITLAGKALSKLNDDEVTLVRRRNVGFIFQFYNLVPTLTAEENIALPLLIDGRNVDQYRSKIDELLKLVDLTDRRHHKPDQLSGGQQQRVAIARAFVTDPDIVLADEPTGNLDSKSGKAILELLRHSCDELGHTIVMVTHDAYAASYADRVVFLKDGRVIRDLQRAGHEGNMLQAIMDVMGHLESSDE